LATMAGADGTRLRWAAAPVWDTDEIGAVVLTAAELEPERKSHADLLRWLIAGCAVLTLAAAGAGHLLSGRSMRPALRAVDQQEQFLAEAAHELRTPLAVLRLAVEDGGTEGSRGPAARRDVLRLVDHLDRLVAGLLSRARLEAGTRQLELTPLRLDQLVEQVVDALPRHSADITVRTEPTIVLGDPDLLAQAVRNLVENAVRHGRAADGPSPVEVRVATGRVSVRDRGPGIAAQEREKIFGDGVSGGRGGIGVGLAIVRWVAELHGGTAGVAEAAGDGALVELVLPEHSPS
jgi:two-component system, OmpR family, sensor kinase